MPELIAIKLSSIHESLRLLCLRTLAKFHICKASWQVHSFVHSQFNVFHCAKSGEDLMDMLLLHISCEMANMKTAGLSFRRLVLLADTSCTRSATMLLKSYVHVCSICEQLLLWLEVLALQLAHQWPLPLVCHRLLARAWFPAWILL